MIVLNNVSKSYRSSGQEQRVIRHLSLQIQDNEFITIRGRSGSGKSTLLHLIGAIDTLDQGQIFYSDKDLSTFSTQDLLHYRRFVVAHIFQFFHLFPRLSVLDNVLLPARLSGRANQDTMKRAQSLLKTIDLQEAAHKPAQVLSGGEMQRVAIARALINSPQILLADEPTGNLDSQNAQKVLELIDHVHQREKITVILVTHDDTVFRHGNKRFEMTDGELRAL